MRLTLYQLDAFTDAVFGGNPAAVVPLSDWLPEECLQAIAAENNLSETAFFVPEGDGRFALRWFTPTQEVDLCGHATLASGALILSRLEPHRDAVHFLTRRAGMLTVSRIGDAYRMVLPARPATPVAVPHAVVEALGGAKPVEALRSRDLVLVYETASTVRTMMPDPARLAAAESASVCVTAPGDRPGLDLVARFFAPNHGIPEDPVTGSAFCTLVPYWHRRLAKPVLTAHQVSNRLGKLSCCLEQDRVVLVGDVVLYLEGTINLAGTVVSR